MKLAFKILGSLVLIVVIAVGAFLGKVALTGIPSYPTNPPDLKVEVTPERVARGKVISNMLCSQCHLDSKTGRLTGHAILDLPAEFGAAFSKNITQDKDVGIGGWTDGEIAFLLRTGINKHGKYTPPWMVKLPRIDDEEIASIIAFLRSGDSLVQADPTPDRESEPTFLVKFLTHVAFKPFEYPTAPIKAPDTADRIVYGKYLSEAFHCFTCHSGDFKKMNEREPEKSYLYFGGGNAMPGLDGVPVLTSNLTPDPATGIGKWSEEEFVKALREGIRPDGRPVRYPMVRYPEFTEGDAKAIYAFLKTVPAIVHDLPRNFPDLAGGAALSDGKAIYKKYGCVGCHGETGVGIGDITLAKRDFPADSALKAWIQNPPAIRPLTKMPPFQGIIKEEEFAPLIAYVRELGEKGGH